MLRPNLCLQKVQNELLVVYTNQLLEKEHSGCRVLLRDDKVLNSCVAFHHFWEVSMYFTCYSMFFSFALIAYSLLYT